MNIGCEREASKRTCTYIDNLACLRVEFLLAEVMKPASVCFRVRSEGHFGVNYISSN